MKPSRWSHVPQYSAKGTNRDLTLRTVASSIRAKTRAYCFSFPSTTAMRSKYLCTATAVRHFLQQKSSLVVEIILAWDSGSPRKASNCRNIGVLSAFVLSCNWLEATLESSSFELEKLDARSETEANLTGLRPCEKDIDVLRSLTSSRFSNAVGDFRTVRMSTALRESSRSREVSEFHNELAIDVSPAMHISPAEHHTDS
jgi:hypothetical protein